MNGDASILESLEASGVLVPRVRLRDAAESTTPLRRSGRYHVLGEISRSGISTVFKARDVDLGREVVLKVLSEHGLEDRETVRRFLEEAQIGGQLQHSGIVPVYELGLDDRGRPFFARKLVRGETLAARLEPGRANERRALLGVFEDVCRTIAYAHARGVAHRDLNPSNVVIGEFGEVVVVGWDSARVLRRGGEPVADDASAGTGAPGHGHPAYMPPEQARDGADSLDRRSDVFSLGAILCELLTGSPPYAGDDLLQSAAAARLEDAYARIDACDEDEALRSLCRTALAASPADRPEHAARLADAVAVHLADVDDRARRADVVAAEARAEAERVAFGAQRQRRARRLSISLAAMVLAALALGGGGWSLLDARDREARSRKQEAISLALEEAQRLRGRGSYDEAVHAAERAAALGSTRAATLAATVRVERDRAEAERAEREHVAGLAERIERIRAQWGRSSDWGDTDDAYARLFADVGIAPEPAAARVLQASPLRDELLLALDFWLVVRRDRRSRRFAPWNGMLALANAVEQSDWRRELRRAFHDRDRDALERIAAGAATRPVAELDLLGAMVNVLGAYDAAVDLYRGASRRVPDDFRVNLNLAHALSHAPAPRREEAIRYYEAAIAIRPASSQPRFELVDNLMRMGRFEDALLVAEDLARIDPGHPGAARLRRDVLLRLGRMEDAIPELRARDDEASLLLLYWISHETRDVALRLDVSRRLAAGWPESSVAAALLVEALRATRREEEAERALDAALRRWPSEPYLNRHLAQLLVRRGLGLDACLAQYRERVQPTPPGEEAFLDGLWSAFGAQRRSDAALAAAAAAVRASPTHFAPYHRRGRSLSRAGELQEAVDDFGKALTLQPDAHAIRIDLAKTLWRLGRADEALSALEPALLAGEWQAHGLYVDLCSMGGRLEKAIAFYRERREHLPPAHFYWHLALCHFRAGRDREAIELARECLATVRWSVGVALNFGNALLPRGDFDGAAQAFREALRLRPRLPWVHEGLLMAHVLAGRSSEALAHAREQMKLLPGTWAQHGLGLALGSSKTWREALADYEALDLDDAQRLRHRFASGAAEGLLARGRAEDALAAVVYGRGSAAADHALLSVEAQARLALGRPVEAAAAARESIRLLARVPPESAELLAGCLAEQGRFSEAAQGYLHAATLARSAPAPVSASLASRREQVADLQALAAEMTALAGLEPRLAEVLGTTPSDSAVALRCARLCARRQEYATAVRLFRVALREVPATPRSVRAGIRCLAARAASRALAAGAEGDERARLVEDIRGWMEEELGVWRDPATLPRRVQNSIHLPAVWLVHPDLGAARAESELAEAFGRFRELVQPRD